MHRLRRSLRVRLLAIVVLVALIPMTLLSFVTNVLAFNAQRSAVFSQQQALADAASAQVGFLLDGAVGDLQELGSLRELIALGISQQEVALGSLVTVSPLYRDLVLLDEEGTVAVGIARERGQTLEETGLSEAFLTPSRSGETYFGPVTFDERSGVPYTLIATPIDSLMGPMDTNIIVADINLLPLSEVLGTLGTSVPGQVYMLDEQGRVVAHQDVARARERAAINVGVQPGSPDFGTGLDGSRVILATSTLDFGGQQFTLVSEVPVSMALQAARSSILASGVLTVIAVGLSLALGFVLAQQIVTPVRKLAISAEAIAGGDLTQRAPVTSDDEIGELARSFNHMAAELELRVAEVAEQQRYLRKVIDASPTLIYVKDSSGRFVLVNRAGAEVYDQTPESMIGKTHADFNPNPDEVRLYEKTDQQVFAQGRPLLIPEESVTAASGDVRYVQTIKVPIEDAKGSVTQVLVVGTDISDRLAAEREREELLERERLARREAQEANRAKDLFLATMSHELRTPLNAIIGFLGLMMFSEQLDEDNAHMAERSIVNAERLLSLINNILDLSRISAGRLEITPVPCDLQALGEALRDDMRLRVADKGLDFIVEIDPDLPRQTTHDEERLTQIATNLIGNAVKFTDEGSIVLRMLRDDEQLVITVTDTGIGIPISKQEIIFDEFTQVDATSTRAYGGAGLGLSIVKRLTVLMGGTVAVESTPGGGTTFTVRVPLDLTPTTQHV